MFVESLPIAGFVLPGLSILVIAGFLSAEQPSALTGIMFIAAWAGLLVADTLMFWLGRVGTTKVNLVRRKVEKHDKLRREISSQPLALLLLYQFPPYSRMFAPLLMGTLSFTWCRWLSITTAGSFAFVAAFFGLGLTVGLIGRSLVGAVSIASLISGIFMWGLLIWIVILGLKLRRRKVDSPGTVT